jgi:hypothetical protein
MAAWFSFAEENFLDYLLIFWLFWSVAIVLIVNSVLTFFGPLQPRVHLWEQARRAVSGAPLAGAVPGGAEGCQWLNTGLNWVFLHYPKFPEFVDDWIRALNEQVVKLGVSASI